MRILLRILAAFAAVVFVFATLSVVLLRPWGTRALRAAVYKDALVGERIYERTPELVGEALRVAAESRDPGTQGSQGGEGATQDVFAEAMRQLEPRDWDTLLGGAVPPALLRAEVEKGLDQAEQFIHGEAASASAVISLVEVKQRLTSGAVTEAYASMRARTPPCTAEHWESSMGVPGACRQSPDKMAEALETFGKITAAMAGELPDSIELLEGLEQLAGPEGSVAELERIRSSIRLTELIARWSPIVPVALALLILLFAVRSVRDLLLWWGVPCLVAGAVGSVLALSVISVGIGSMNTAALADLPASAPMALVEAIFGTVGAVIRTIMAPALWGSLVLAGGGFVAVVLAFIIRPKAAPPPLGPA